jgi:hypothetical protein
MLSVWPGSPPCSCDAVGLTITTRGLYDELVRRPLASRSAGRRYVMRRLRVRRTR